MILLRFRDTHGKKLTSHNEMCGGHILRDTIEIKYQNLSKRKNYEDVRKKKAIKTKYDEEDKKIKNCQV